ncbi:outer membrane beta-barrel protein [Galbibacter sp.]|uniref:outer membrane beta-barrel protein n=1 Tax=Galbibacter sp. TaxID=2918471 RepID=UPI003A910002
MEERKNIERFFQEKFKNFEETPPEHIWENIDQSLSKKGNNRRVIPLWWKIAGAAALLAGILWTGNFMFSPEPSNSIQGITGTKATDSINVDTVPQESVVSTDKNENPDTTTPLSTKNNTNSNPESDPHPTQASDNIQVAAKEKGKSHNTRGANDQVTKNKDFVEIEAPKNDAIAKVEQTDVAKVKKDISIPTANDPATTKNGIPLDDAIDKQQALAENNIQANDTLQDNSGKPSLLEAIDAMEKENQKALASNDDSQKNLRWSVQPNVAPVYYNTLSKGSPLSQQFAENSKQGDVTISFGVNIAYQISKRLSVRSGLNTVNMGYATDGIEFGPAISSTQQHQLNVRFNSNSPSGVQQQPNIALSDGKTPLYNPDSELQARSEKTYQGSINQKLGYLEVPVELKYRLVDKKIGVNIIGGFSSLFLTDNKVTISSDNHLKSEVGEASNLNDTSFSTNIGLGLDYQFSDKLLFNIEPMFKYQMGTFSSDDGGFSPYMLGVYTGLSFSF